ncbi:TPA: DUF551 domain-containing protein [Klebsiella oxytoca]|uniref:DUF551 domain-containing protein n=1 Tax=Klebsiella oxytoca TaxID=571 RepID=UPI003753D818
MTKSTITREQLLEIIETDHVQCGEASYLARMALAAMDGEPVAYMTYKGYLLHAGDPKLAEYSEPMPLYADPRPEPISAEPVAWLLSGGGAKNVVVFDGGNAYADPLREVTPLYRHAQPAPVAYSDFEEFWSAYIHPLAQDDELKGFAWDIWSVLGSNSQPAPVVPEEVTAEDCPALVKYDVTEVDEAWARGFNACRAAMLQAGNSPAQSDCCPAQNVVAPAQSQGWIPVSERMPEDEQEVLTINRMGHRFVSFFDKHSGLYFDRLDAPAACCIEHVLVTHWMPLPAAPQEVKGE